MTKISVIITAYNKEKYLDHCVESIVNQTYTDLEIILVDDGSTDHSPELCDAWEKKDARVKVIHKENGGLSDARNRGMDAATGDFIVFADGDDWVEKTCYETAVNAMEEDISIVVWSYEKDFVDAEEQLQKTVPFLTEDLVISRDGDPKALLKENVLGNIGYAWNKLYRRETIQNLRFEKGLSMVEDYVFNADVFCQNDRIRFLPCNGTHYVQRDLPTLAKKDYRNYRELRMRAAKAKWRILKSFGVSFPGRVGAVAQDVVYAHTPRTRKFLKKLLKKG